MSDYEKKETIYFASEGRQNTEAVAVAVKERCAELGIKHVVVASNSGASALLFHDILKEMDVAVVCVTWHCGYSGQDKIGLTPELDQKLRDAGVKIVMCSHALSGVNRSISSKFGGTTPVEIIAHTLRRFSQGIKVAVEISVMAADAAAVPTTEDIICVGGSGRGSDSAVILRAAHMNNFFDLKVREIIAMPR